MKVFAIVPVFNRLALTREIVECLRAQAGVNLDIVVVDDGSTDGTSQYLAAQRDVFTIRGSGNLWWAGAVQLALRHALRHATDRDHVLLVNNDTTFDADFTARLLDVSRELGGAVVGGVLRNRRPPHEILSIGPCIHAASMAVHDLLDTLPASERVTPRRIYHVDALPGRGTLYPLAVFRRAGLLRPRLLPHYMADYELAMRARRYGYSTVVATEAVVYSDNSFGSQVRAGSWLARNFGKGSPCNVLHQSAFRMMVAWPYRKPTKAPAFVLKSVVIGLLLLFPGRVRHRVFQAYGRLRPRARDGSAR